MPGQGEPQAEGDIPLCRGGSRRPGSSGEEVEQKDPSRFAEVPTSPEEIELDERLMAGLGHGCRGYFITFEGLDGTGKSTQMELLAQSLRAAGHPLVTAREPGGTSLGEVVREALLNKTEGEPEMDPRAEAFLYTAARVQLVEEVIRPALEAGEIVLCDRYIDSSLAYQGYGRGLGYENIISMNMWAVEGLLPDLTLVLLTPEAARRRRLGGAEADRLESSGDDFFRRVDEGYRRLVADHPYRIRAIDGGGGVEEVAERVREVVQEELDLDLGPQSG